VPFLVLPALAACGEGEAARPGAATTFAPATVTVQRGLLRVVVQATGQVEPVRRVDVKSKASGVIMAMHAEVGDRVQAGALLVEIDPRDVRNAHQEAEAELAVARARMEVAESRLTRSLELLRTGVITEQENEGATLDFADARSGLVRGETNLELARLRLEDVVIRSPLTGTVLQRPMQPGEVIAAAASNVEGGATLLTMADLDRIRIRVSVPEGETGRLRPGLPVTIRTQAFPDRTFVGTVERVEPSAYTEQTVTLFPVLVSLENPDWLLKPGMNATVEILAQELDDALLLPPASLVEPGQFPAAAELLGVDPTLLDLPPAPWPPDLRVVFVVRSDGSLEPRAVTLAVATSADAAVSSGLDEGEEVVTFATAATGASRPGGGGGPRFF